MWLVQLVTSLITPASGANDSMVDATGMVIGAYVLLSAQEYIGPVRAAVGLDLDTPLLPLLCGESGNRFSSSASLPCAPLLVVVYDEGGPCI